MALMKKTKYRKGAGESKERKPLHAVGGNANQGSHRGQQMEAPRKLNVQPPCDPALPPLGIMALSGMGTAEA